MNLQKGISPRQHAINAVSLFPMINHSSRKKEEINASVYGIAFKYILFTRGISQVKASRLTGYKTPQAWNYIVNAKPEEKFYAEEISCYCELLDIDEDMFLEMCKEIKLVLRNADTDKKD